MYPKCVETPLVSLFVAILALQTVPTAYLAQASEEPVPEIPVTLVRFTDYRPGGGPGQQNLTSFMNTLKSLMSRFHIKPVMVSPDDTIPSVGIVIKDQVNELPSVFESEGRVSFSCSVILDGQVAKSSSYFQRVTVSGRARATNDEPQRRAVELAVNEFLIDLQQIINDRQPKKLGTT